MNRITNTAVLQDIRKVAKKVRLFTREAYREKGRFASSTVERKFGSFSSAARSARVTNRFVK